MEKIPLTGSKRYKQLDAHIGQGTYGKVEKALDLFDNEIVALKKIKVEGFQETCDGSLNCTDDILRSRQPLSMLGIHFTVLREISIMREFNHPNIISIKDVYVEDEFVNLVMPFMCSDLRKLFERRIRLTEAQVKCIMKQVTLGLKELHTHWCLHRDLSPGNIVFNSSGICKLVDFGLSRTYGSPRPTEKSPKIVTLWYRAPEILYGATCYQDRIDTWSLGCIFAELLMNGKPLFAGTCEIDQLSRIFELCGTPCENNWPEAAQLPGFFEFTHTPPKSFSKVFMGIPKVALDLLEKLLTLDPYKRLSASMALDHPYFSSNPPPCQLHELPLQLLS